MNNRKNSGFMPEFSGYLNRARLRSTLEVLRTKRIEIEGNIRNLENGSSKAIQEKAPVIYSRILKGEQVAAYAMTLSARFYEAVFPIAHEEFDRYNGIKVKVEKLL